MEINNKLFLNTVNENLWKTLLKLMSFQEFYSFRLVGGTALSLFLGHRISIDIDLFTDAPYGSIDFEKIDSVLNDNFKIVQHNSTQPISFGKTYFIGNDEKFLVKLDLFYTDDFVFPQFIKNEIRFGSVEEIIAMKLETICNTKRKKDFWDLHELLEHFSLNNMIKFHARRYPFTHNKEEIFRNLKEINLADDDFDPICLKSKYWELIIQDFKNLKK